MHAVKKHNQLYAISEMSVVNLILLDHRFLKQCIKTLLNGRAERSKLLFTARNFLAALEVHSRAEKEAVYSRVEANEELHFHVLEAKVEHDIIDRKVAALRPLLEGRSALNDELKAELKVLSQLLTNHLMEEESDFLPRLNEAIDDETLIEMAGQFDSIRHFDESEMKNFSLIREELIDWRNSIKKISTEVLTKMDKFVEDLPRKVSST